MCATNKTMTVKIDVKSIRYTVHNSLSNVKTYIVGIFDEFDGLRFDNVDDLDHLAVDWY